MTYLIENLSEEFQKNLASRLKKRTFKEIIINDGDFFDKIIFIVKGSIKCLKNNNIVKTILENDYFGDIGLFLENTSYYTYEPIQEVLVYELEYYQVAEIIGQDYANVIVESLFKESIKNSNKLKDYFIGDRMSTLYNIFHLEYFKNEQIVYSKKLRINKKIGIIISGKLVKKSQENCIVAEREDLFGETIIDSTEKYIFSLLIIFILLNILEIPIYIV